MAGSAGFDRIAVLGGTGFVGQALAQRWPRGHPPPLYLVHRSQPAWLGETRVDLRQVNLSDPAAVAAAAEGAPVVVNLLRPDGTGWAAAVIAQLLPQFADVGVRRFVHSSSIDVYGATREALVSATTTPEPQTPYEREHHAIEQLVRGVDMERCIVRLGAVFGIGGVNLKAFVPEIKSGPRLKLAARRALYGRRRMHLVSVENVADVLILAATTPQPPLPEMLLACDDAAEENNFASVQAAMMARFGRRPLDRWPLLPPRVLQASLRILGRETRRPVRRYTDRGLEELGFKPEAPFTDRIEAFAGNLVAREGAR